MSNFRWLRRLPVALAFVYVGGIVAPLAGAAESPRVEEARPVGGSVTGASSDVPESRDFPHGPQDKTGPITNAKFYSYGPVCDKDSWIAASEGEDGHWLAERITLPKTPYAVESIGFGLAAGSDPLDFNVELYVTDGILPPSNPVVLDSFERDDVAPFEHVKVNIELDEPLIVEEGEDLIIAIEMRRTGPNDYNLVRTCGNDLATDTTFWSNAADAPYSWVDLSSFGFPGQYYMWGTGHVVE